MTWDAKNSSIGSIVLRICFLFLIIKGLSSSSSSYESSILFCSPICICLGDLLDDARSHLVCCNLSFNFDVFTLDVKASCTPTGAVFGNIYYFAFGKKCCIKISMVNVEWSTSFLGSTFIIPINIFVWEVVHLINSLISCLNKVTIESTTFLFMDVIMDMTCLLLK